MSSSSTRKTLVIVGSGPCGLGAAWRIEELIAQGNQQWDWIILESGKAAGGLACSVVDDNGFTWDMGGHVIFSHYAYFTNLLTALLGKDGWNDRVREAWVWMRDQFIPYPLQVNVHRLPLSDKTKIIDGLLHIFKNSSTFPKPKNFKEWLEQGFGSGLCEAFMYPYNRKVWAFDPEEMNTEWMGERVATLDTAKILKNMVECKDELGWGPNAKFRFPLHGGTGAIWTALYEQLPKEKILFNSAVTSVNASQKILRTAAGKEFHYDALLSTMPMDVLCRMTHELPGFTEADLQEKSKQFRYSSSHIVGFGIEGSVPEHLKTKCWLYFPEDDCPFYRCTVFSNYSPFNVPKPGQQWSLMCEVSESFKKHVDLANIVAQTEQGLLNTKLLRPSDKVVSRYHTRLEYGYPTPFYGRDQLCGPIFAALEKQRIFSRGRFGAWKYEVSNQDHTMMQGVEAVDAIVLGSEESTFRFPGIVNARMDGQGREVYLPRIRHDKDKEQHKEHKQHVSHEQEEKK